MLLSFSFFFLSFLLQENTNRGMVSCVYLPLFVMNLVNMRAMSIRLFILVAGRGIEPPLLAYEAS